MSDAKIESAGGTKLEDGEMKGLFFEDEPEPSIPPKYQGNGLTKEFAILGERPKNGEWRPMQGHPPYNRSHVPADVINSESRTSIPNTDPFFSNLYTHPPAVETTSLSQSHHRYEPSPSRDVIPVTTEQQLDTPSSFTEPKPFTTHACTAEFSPAQVPAALRILQYIKSHPATPEGVNSPIPHGLITSELAEIRDGWGRCLIGACYAARERETRASAEKASNVVLSSISMDHACGKVGSRRRADSLYDHIRNEHLRYRPYWCETW
jgi:hypothetical protein